MTTGKTCKAQYLHTLGNLHPDGLQLRVLGSPFTMKRDMEGGFKDSPLRLNKGTGQAGDWNAEEIGKRAERLAQDSLAIWTRPQLSAEILADFQEVRAESDFSIEDHPHLLPQARRDLFEKFQARRSRRWTRASRASSSGFYVAFKAETNFADVVPQKARMRLSLNIPSRRCTTNGA